MENERFLNNNINRVDTVEVLNFSEEVESESKIHNPNLDRVQRDIVISKKLENYTNGDVGESLESQLQDRKMFAGMIGRRNWGNMFDKIDSGDKLVSYIVPSNPIFSIKSMNDKIYGHIATDEVIQSTRNAARNALDAIEITQGYKDGFFVIKNDSKGTLGEITENLEDASKQIKKEVTEFMLSLLDIQWVVDKHTSVNNIFNNLNEDYFLIKNLKPLIGDPRRFSNSSEFENFLKGLNREDQIKVKSIMTQQFKDGDLTTDHANFRAELEDPKKGYNLTFGIADVDEPNLENADDYSYLADAVAKSVKGAILARDSQDTSVKEYDSADLMKKFEQIYLMRDKFMGLAGDTSYTNEIVNDMGQRFSLFIETARGLHFNKDVLRDIRKGTFKVIDDENSNVSYNALLLELDEYIRALNILDIVNPYTYKELQGGIVHGTDQTISEQHANNQKMVEMLNDKDKVLTTKEWQQVKNLLSLDEKDPNFTSKMEFAHKAIKIPDCTYLSLDALDIGPDLLIDYEDLIFKARDIPNQDRDAYIQNAIVTAGDATTNRMRKRFRKVAHNVLLEHLGQDYDLLFKVGGDEITLALPTELATEELIMSLHSALNTRIVKTSVKSFLSGPGSNHGSELHTVISKSERSSDISDTEQTIKDHLEAIKIAELGEKYAKETERKIRELEFYIDRLPIVEQSKYFDLIKSNNIHNYIISQIEHGQKDFEVIIRNNSHFEKISYNELGSRISSIRTEVRNDAIDKYTRYFEQKGHNIDRSIIVESLSDIIRYDKQGNLANVTFS